MDLAAAGEVNKNVTDFTSKVGREWNEMSSEEKLTYRHDATLGSQILKKSEELAAQDSGNKSTKAASTHLNV